MPIVGQYLAGVSAGRGEPGLRPSFALTVSGGTWREMGGGIVDRRDL